MAPIRFQVSGVRRLAEAVLPSNLPPARPDSASEAPLVHEEPSRRKEVGGSLSAGGAASSEEQPAVSLSATDAAVTTGASAAAGASQQSGSERPTGRSSCSRLGSSCSEGQGEAEHQGEGRLHSCLLQTLQGPGRQSCTHSDPLPSPAN